MNAVEEENFPRGGRKVTKAPQNKRKSDDNLFPKGRQSKERKKDKEKKAVNKNTSEDGFQSSLQLQGTLTYDKIQEGMIILSCVRNVSNMMVELEHPGLTYSQLSITAITDPFLEKVTETLKNLDEEANSLLRTVLKPGQLLPAKIQSIRNTGKGHEVCATINPKDINAGSVHSSFRKGMLVWVCVLSELDHGYEVDLGVKNCRAFLPHKNVDKDNSYSVGQPLFCVIHKSEGYDVATTLTVSAKKEHLNKIQLKEVDSLSNVIPGSKVEFVVEEVTRCGVKGKYLDTYIAYVDKSQFFPLKKFENVKVGNTLEALVLYHEPMTKVTYLTLRQFVTLPPPPYPVGTILKAEIQQLSSRGLYLNLGKNQMGFITNNRLIKSLGKDSSLNVMQSVRGNFPIGNKKQCRILDYNHLDQLYICTFEKDVINEQLFTADNFEVGQVVEAKVVKIVPNGVIVLAGNVRGFIPNLHLSNVTFTQNLKSKFTEGQSLTAKVLNIDDGHIVYTLKKGLIESNCCLTTNDEAVVNNQYTGFVACTKSAGALIAFYGTAKGWISNKELNLDNDLGRYCDPRKYFFRGQVVTVWCLGVKDKLLQLALNPPKKNFRNTIKIGFKLSGIVSGCTNDCINVDVGPKKISTSIPVNHLSNVLGLCSSLLKTYKVGDSLQDLLCVKAGDYPVLSIREFTASQKGCLKIGNFRDLKEGMILRCSFEKKTSSGIYVSFPIKDYVDNFFIENENVFNKKETCPKFQFQQCVLAKILSIEYKSKTIKLGMRTDQLSTFKKINYSVNLLSQFIEEQDKLINFGSSNNWDLTQYELGCRVVCTIINLSPNCTVVLPNGVKGNVPLNLCLQKMKIGQKIEGVVIFIDFANNSVDISLKNNQKINKKQDGIIKKSLFSSCMVNILLKKDNCIIGVLNEKICNRQLVYLPVHFYENDGMDISEAYKKHKLKVVLLKKTNNKLIGMSKRLVYTLDKKYFKSFAPTTIEAQNNETTEKPESSETGDSELEEIEKNTEEEPDSELKETEEPEETKKPKETTEAEDIPDLESEIIMKSIPVVSGMENFFDVQERDSSEEDSSDEDSEEKVPKKKRKLTPAERAELARLEEERLLKIEKELADSEFGPQSVEHFERLLLARPNSSKLWMQYIAMYISNNELDKARAVGRRALDTINMTEIKEKFNIWICLLNLENLYGTSEEFDRLFNEAVRYNDAFDVYLTVIKLFAKCGKFQEMEEKIKRIRWKERQNINMWLEIGKVYYEIGKFREARNFKQAALKSVTEKKKQFDLIIRFAIIEFQLGEFEMAVANFETILETFPSKVNVWLIYVDQLIKKEKFDSAREVLERGILQKLCVRSMKTLFEKFVRFEEEYGVKENVEKVKQQAKEYVNNFKV